MIYDHSEKLTITDMVIIGIAGLLGVFFWWLAVIGAMDVWQTVKCWL